MSPELQMMLSEMHADIRETRDRVREIELKRAGSEGATKTRGRIVETIKWAVMVAAAAFTGHVAAHH